MTRSDRYYHVAQTLMRSARLVRYQLGAPDMALVARLVANARQYARMARNAETGEPFCSHGRYRQWMTAENRGLVPLPDIKPTWIHLDDGSECFAR